MKGNVRNAPISPINQNILNFNGINSAEMFALNGFGIHTTLRSLAGMAKSWKWMRVFSPRCPKFNRGRRLGEDAWDDDEK